MTVDITWAKDKSDITTHDTQTKTFNSEEQAIEWIRRNAKHIVSILWIVWWMDMAENNWNYVKNGIAEINDNSRCSKALKDFKNRVTKVSDDNDSIWNSHFNRKEKENKLCHILLH